jgi:hypothetical protein
VLDAGSTPAITPLVTTICAVGVAEAALEIVDGVATDAKVEGVDAAPMSAPRPPINSTPSGARPVRVHNQPSIRLPITSPLASPPGPSRTTVALRKGAGDPSRRVVRLLPARQRARVSLP